MTENGSAFSSCSSSTHRPAPEKPCLCSRQLESDRNETSGSLCYSANARSLRHRRATLKQRRSIRLKLRRCESMHRFIFVVLLGFMLCSQRVQADIHVASPLRQRSELLFDRRDPPAPRERLQPRDLITDPSNSQQTTLPSPFDTSLGNNFTTTSCPAFFQSFLQDPTFNACLPFSLLLQTSNGFFTATRSLLRLTQTLDATCKVDYHQCSSVMNTLAEQIQLQSNCGADLSMQNPMVEQAYNGFIAYDPLYHAGCLKNDDGAYCFGEAVTNTTSSSSSYVYYLPLGMQLPSTTQPTCNTCLRNTMSIFATYASNGTQPLSDDYTTAAQQVDKSCGAKYVESTVKVTSSSSAARLFGRNTAVLTLSLIITLSHLLL